VLVLNPPAFRLETPRNTVTARLTLTPPSSPFIFGASKQGPHTHWYNMSKQGPHTRSLVTFSAHF
jgi:hypothetical protein